MEDEYGELVNKERMWRNVICINPSHDTIIMYTQQKFPKCPLCENLMVTLVKTTLDKNIDDSIG